MLSPVLIEALESVAIAMIGAGNAVPAASLLSRFISRSEHTVTLRLVSGKEVHLDLDNRLSPDEVSSLVAAAVRSAQSGDEAAVRRTIEASHAASREARETASEFS